MRFDSAESAQKGLARADAEGTIQLGEGDDKRAAKLALITGDEEQALIDKVLAFISGMTLLLKVRHSHQMRTDMRWAASVALITGNEKQALIDKVQCVVNTPSFWRGETYSKTAMAT